MFDHVGIGVSDLATSRRFFQSALAPLGVEALMTVGDSVGLGRDGKPRLRLNARSLRPSALHLAFSAASPAQAQAFYHAALQAGGIDNGAPDLRPHYHPHYYAAFVIAPDGHNVEAVYHGG